MATAIKVREQGRRTKARQTAIPQPVATCPVAQVIFETREGTAVNCPIEESVLSVGRDPSSLLSFCMGDYTRCPTWQAEKGRVGAKKLIDRDNEPDKTFSERAREMGGEVEWEPVDVTYFEGSD